MKAVERTSAKFRSWVASWRGCMFVRPSMVSGVVEEGFCRGSGRLPWR
jgi:hypothetical protein